MAESMSEQDPYKVLSDTPGAGARRYSTDSSYWAMTGTQFLGAFNDNVFKQLVLLLCVAYVSQSGGQGDTWQSIAQASFALPFVLLSGFGGFLGDRFSKRSIVVLCKVAEIVVMAFGAVALTTSAPDTQAGLIALCGVLFFMGAQSAIFGPAKYGILPEMMSEQDLPPANGIIQMTTFLAIIFGTVVAGQAVESFKGQLWIVTAICIGIAIAGTLTSFFVRKTPVAQPDARLSVDALWINRDLRQLLRADSLMLRVLLLSTLFWFLGGVVIPAVNGFGEVTLGLTESRTSILAAMMGIGIAIGCPIAGALSDGRVRFGIVRLGALGIFASLATVAAAPSMGLTVSQVEGVARTALGCLGFFAGLFAVPLQVFLQARPPKEQKGRMIGSMNLVNWIGILIAAVFHLIVTKILGTGSPIEFLILGLMILPVALFFRSNEATNP